MNNETITIGTKLIGFYTQSIYEVIALLPGKKEFMLVYSWLSDVTYALSSKDVDLHTKTVL